jgi:hypothetical protein
MDDKNAKFWGLLVGGCSILGCGQAGEAESQPSLQTFSQALSSDQERVLGFETALADWSSSAGSLSASGTASQGTQALAVIPQGWTEINSIPLSSLGGVETSVSYDVSVPNGVSWGETRLVLVAPSLGFWWQELGSADLSVMPVGVYQTVTFSLPSFVEAALESAYDDLTLKLVINAPTVAQPYLIDNLVIAEEEVPDTPPQYVVPYDVYFDDSAAPVHVAITVCESLEPAGAQDIFCPAHANYALIGGGAHTTWEGSQSSALLTLSQPLDDYFWRAASEEHLGTSEHTLTVYTIGVRLDGVNTQTLREQIYNSVVANTDGLQLSHQDPSSWHFSSGFSASAGTYAQNLTGVPAGWSYTARPHGNQIDWEVSQLYHRAMSVGILEGFGRFQVAARQGPEVQTGSGVASVQTNVTEGWSLVGLGGTTRGNAGWGRLLNGMFTAGDARVVETSSVDNGWAISGYISNFHMEARQWPGSHGVCSEGTPLSGWMDSCVADICAVSPSCCNSAWSSSCVAQVETVCGQSCEAHQCTTTTLDPDWWIEDKEETNSPRADANCYGYAVNQANNRQPGHSHYGDVGSDPILTARAVAADGLLPIGREEACPDNQNKVALFIRNDYGDYHWLRQDADGTWSHKRIAGAPKNTDAADEIIYDAEEADLTENASLAYSIFAGYFCSCTGPGQGAGKERLDAPGQYKGWPSPWFKAAWDNSW